MSSGQCTICIYFTRESLIFTIMEGNINFPNKKFIYHLETWTWCTNTAITTTETSALRAVLLIQNVSGDFVFVMKVKVWI